MNTYTDTLEVLEILYNNSDDTVHDGIETRDILIDWIKEHGNDEQKKAIKDLLDNWKK